MKVRWPALLIVLGLCLGAGAVGSVFTVPAIPVWYAGLAKPSFSPPNWLFGPVWTGLYILMGISLYLVWTAPTKKPLRRPALILFMAQLGLNILWSVLFFGLASPVLALIDLVVLWAAIALTTKAFYPLSRSASLLLLPYLAWVSFAGLLNFYIVLLN